MESCPQAGNVIATNSREQTCERKRVIGSRFLSNDSRREFHLLGRQPIKICRRHNAGMYPAISGQATPGAALIRDSYFTASAGLPAFPDGSRWISFFEPDRSTHHSPRLSHDTENNCNVTHPTRLRYNRCKPGSGSGRSGFRGGLQSWWRRWRLPWRGPAGTASTDEEFTDQASLGTGSWTVAA